MKPCTNGLLAFSSHVIGIMLLIWKTGFETMAWKTPVLRHIWSLSYRRANCYRRKSVRTAMKMRTLCSTCARGCRSVRWWRSSTCTRRWTTLRNACRSASSGACRSASSGVCSSRPASRMSSAQSSSSSTHCCWWTLNRTPASRSTSSRVPSHSRRLRCLSRSASPFLEESDSSHATILTLQ